MILISDLYYKSYVPQSLISHAGLLMTMKKTNKYKVSAMASQIYGGLGIDTIKSDTFKTLTREVLIIYNDGRVSDRSFLYNSYKDGRQYTMEYRR